ncbi:MAG: hypothetical protein M3307_02035, partial [Thermoproteota archaeon]|nr:hypothetical protein [Thermoproteota archaeon]
AVVGIGVNVNVESSTISSNLERHIKVTSLSDELGHKTSILGLTKEILERLEYYHVQLKNDAPHAIIEQWKKSSDIFNRKVEVMHNNWTVEGVAVDVDNDGSLLVRTDLCNNIKVVASDVRVRY